MEESKLLIELEQKELKANLGNITIAGVPIWRIVRYQSRLKYVSTHSDYVAVSGKTKFIGKRSIKLLSGFWKYFGKKDLTIFYTFTNILK